MQVIKLSQNDEYHLKQRNKIEMLFNLLKSSYHLVTNKSRSLRGYLAGIYALYVLIRFVTKTSQ